MHHVCSVFNYGFHFLVIILAGMRRLSVGRAQAAKTIRFVLRLFGVVVVVVVVV